MLGEAKEKTAKRWMVMLRTIKQMMIFLVVLIFFVGCNVSPDKTAEDPMEVQRKILENMTDQKNYSFQGKTSIKLSQDDVQEVVQFNGYINNKENMYIDLDIAGMEGIPEEKMQIVQFPQKMMVKYTDENEWQEVELNEQELFSEIKMMNPEYYLSLMGKNTSQTEWTDEKEGMKGLLIKLDEEAVREQIETQLSASLDGGLTEEDIQEMKETLGMSDQEIAEMQQELENQMNETRQQIEEMMNTMTIEAYYKIFYDPANLLIQNVEQNIKTDYQLEGEKVQETVMVNIQLTNYGKEKSLPVS